MCKKQGFSLVELAVVLVILGLLAGGILMGQSLIKNAELKSVIDEYQKYTSSAKMFHQKYDALPGDFAIAESVWGQAAVANADCIAAASVGTETCNGNEDGFINSPSTRSNESYRFWQHMANAGFIEGKYTGTTSGANEYTSSLANSPASRFTNGGWFIYNWTGAYAGDAAAFDAAAGSHVNTLTVGRWSSTSWPSQTLFTPEEAWNIDTKIDDGKPGTGSLISYRWATCTNAANSADISTTYRLDSTAQACVLRWPNLFRRL